MQVLLDSPSIAVFEAGGSDRAVDLASEPACQATVAVHHLSVPLIDGVSGALATVLNVSDL